MTDLVLCDREQSAVSAVIATEPVPGGAMPGEAVLGLLARLIESDAIGISLLDRDGAAVGEATRGRARAYEDDVSCAGVPAALGVRRRGRGLSRNGSSARRAVAVLSFGVPNGHSHVALLWLVRSSRDFSDRDRALLGLVAPALERVMRQPPPCTTSSLTVQERRVLHHVAGGLSNAEIADRLVVAPCTVRKHLEHAYRKLGVTNRLAAVHAVEGGRLPEPDPEPDPEPAIRVGSFVGPSAAPWGGQPPRAADTTSLASACTCARCSGPRKDSA